MAHKTTILVAKTKEHLQFFDIGRRSPVFNRLSFLGLGLTMALEMIYPKYFNLMRSNPHLVGLAKRELDLSLDKTHSMCQRCLAVDDEYIRISSKYTV